MEAKAIRNGILDEMGIKVRTKSAGANWEKCGVKFHTIPRKNGQSSYFVDFIARRKPAVNAALTEVKRAARKLGVPMRKMRKYNSNRTDAPRIKYDLVKTKKNQGNVAVWKLELTISYL
jgi:transposase-like protein